MNQHLNRVDNMILPIRNIEAGLTEQKRFEKSLGRMYSAPKGEQYRVDFRMRGFISDIEMESQDLRLQTESQSRSNVLLSTAAFLS